MTNCPKCHTSVQPDAVFCEACGWRLDRPIETSTPREAPSEAKSGSLKERIAILSGPIRQMRAKWPKSNNSSSAASSPGSSCEGNDSPCLPQKRSKKIMSIIVSLLTGIALIAFWVWLLMRKTAEQIVRSLCK